MTPKGDFAPMFHKKTYRRSFESVITVSFSENQRREITSCRTKLKETPL